MLSRSFVLVAWLSLATVAVATDDAPAAPAEEEVLGHFSKCGKHKTPKFEVLPGIGWDNLRNIEAGQVVQFNYSECKTTEDGKYLIPNSVYTIPVKSSYVQTFADYYETWHAQTSTTSNTINVLTGLLKPFGVISGKFSSEFVRTKSKIVNNKAVATRIQLKYYRYKSRLQPDPQLHPSFKARLLNIASQISTGCPKQADYEAQLLVRDFGTHVVTGLTAGAGLVKTDFISKESVTAIGDKHSVVTAAAADFSLFFGIKGMIQRESDSKTVDSYTKAIAYSDVMSHGGPVMKAFNMSSNDWANNLDFELVSMDKMGDPLSFMVTDQTLPELPSFLVDQTEYAVRKAIELYYEMNTIRGCTKWDSPNFSFSANFDDGSCNKKATNLTFGGIYQQCQNVGEPCDKDPCEGLEQTNPKTDDFSCPPAYTPVLLVSGTQEGNPEYHTTCEKVGPFHIFKKCTTRRIVPEAKYSMYWCAATGQVPKESGYLFGGIYSDTMDNQVTGTKDCPKGFFSLSMLQDTKLCVSDDYEEGTAEALPFGGFSSCCMGNPLAAEGNHPVGANASKKQSALRRYMAGAGGKPSSWPKKCPEGYSQHMAAVEDGCEVRYCVRSGDMDTPEIPPVKRPPFCKRPPSQGGNSVETVMFDVETQTWYKNDEVIEQQLKKASAPRSSGQKGNGGDASDGNDSLSAASYVGIAIGAVVGLVALTAMVTIAIKRRSATGSIGNERLTDMDNAETRYGGTTQSNPTFLLPRRE